MADKNRIPVPARADVLAEPFGVLFYTAAELSVRMAGQVHRLRIREGLQLVPPCLPAGAGSVNKDKLHGVGSSFFVACGTFAIWGSYQYPFHCGERFSAKALGPSTMSAD